MIRFIQHRCLFNDKDLEHEVLLFRVEQFSEISHKEAMLACDALERYVNLLKPYDGKPIGTIPLAVLEAATEAQESHAYHQRIADRYYKQHEKAWKRIDEISGRKPS